MQCLGIDYLMDTFLPCCIMLQSPLQDASMPLGSPLAMPLAMPLFQDLDKACSSGPSEWSTSTSRPDALFFSVPMLAV